MYRKGFFFVHLCFMLVDLAVSVCVVDGCYHDRVCQFSIKPTGVSRPESHICEKREFTCYVAQHGMIQHETPTHNDFYIVYRKKNIVS